MCELRWSTFGILQRLSNVKDAVISKQATKSGISGNGSSDSSNGFFRNYIAVASTNIQVGSSDLLLKKIDELSKDLKATNELIQSLKESIPSREEVIEIAKHEASIHNQRFAAKLACLVIDIVKSVVPSLKSSPIEKKTSDFLFNRFAQLRIS